MVITGKIDRVLKPSITSELRILAESRGANVFDGKDYAHPFMDRDSVTHQDRMRRTIEFLSSVGDEKLNRKPFEE